MKKMTRSSKKGFTLAEIILVVAIIVIVSAASFVGVGAIINNAKNTSKKLEENNGENFEAEAWGEVKSITHGAADFFDIPYYTPEDDDEDDEGDEPESTEPGGGWAGGGSGGGGGGGTPASEPSFRPTATPVPTATPTPKPAGGGITVGNVSVPGGYNNEMNQGVGVMSVTPNGNGYDIKCHSSTNIITLTIKPDGSVYIMTYTNGMQWMLDGMPGYNWGTSSYRLDDSQLNWLESKFGFKISK